MRQKQNIRKTCVSGPLGLQLLKQKNNKATQQAGMQAVTVITQHFKQKVQKFTEEYVLNEFVIRKCLSKNNKVLIIITLRKQTIM